MNKKPIIKKALLGMSGRCGFMQDQYYLVESRIVSSFSNLGKAIAVKAKFEDCIQEGDYTIIKMKEK